VKIYEKKMYIADKYPLQVKAIIRLGVNELHFALRSQFRDVVISKLFALRLF
jgi:hypothetical protein